MTDKNKCQCSCDECGAECEPFYRTNKTIQEVKHLLSTGQRTSISTKTFEEIIELLEQKEQECEELKKDCPRRCKSDEYKQALDEIEKVICKLESASILTFPDFSKEENLKIVMKQCNSGYIEIQNIINKVKGDI